MKCPVCNSENPLYESICQNCKARLRNRVANIELGETILLLLHNPSKAFLNIIYSEKKNYTAILFFISSIKYLLLNYILLAILYRTSFAFLSGMILNLSILFLVFSALTAFYLFVMEKNTNSARFIDFFSIYAYSSLPAIISIILFFPLEIIIFGEFFFTFDPSPFLINPFFAYLFLGLEIILLIWQIVLMSIGLNVIGKKRVRNFIFTVLALTMMHLMTFILFSYLIEINRKINLGT